MFEKYPLSVICEFLRTRRDSEPQLAPKLSDDAIEDYLHFCRHRNDKADALPCPLCFLTKGRIQYLLPPRPPQRQGHGSHLICEFCYVRFPTASDI